MHEYYDNNNNRQTGFGFGFGPGGSFFFPGMGGQQGPPSFGPPSAQPGQGFGPPSGPPPTVTPTKPSSQQAGIFAVDPGAIRPCTFRFVFLWLTTGERFWAWLTFVGRRSAAGWRWTGFRWIYFGVDLDNIESFVCY